MTFFMKNVLLISSVILFATVSAQLASSQSITNYELEQEINALKEKVEGTGVFGGLSFSGAFEVETGIEHGYGVAPFMVIGEYVAATDDLEFTTTPKQEAPGAYNMEIGYTFELMGKELTMGVAYQGTHECGGSCPRHACLRLLGLASGKMWARRWSMPTMRTTMRLTGAPEMKQTS